MNPDDLRDAFYQSWMRQYLNRTPSPFWEVERKKVVARALLIAELEHMWALPEREEP